MIENKIRYIFQILKYLGLVGKVQNGDPFVRSKIGILHGSLHSSIPLVQFYPSSRKETNFFLIQGGFLVV